MTKIFVLAMTMAVIVLALSEAKIVDVSPAKDLPRQSRLTPDGNDILNEVVDALADANLVHQEQGIRQPRDNPLTDLVFGVFKEIVSELLTSTLGNFLGVQTERNSNDDISLISMILSAVRKNTLQKRMGCPT